MSVAINDPLPNENATDLWGNRTESELDWNDTATWTFSDSPSSSPSTTPSALPSMAPSSAPTSNIDKFVNSNDSQIIAKTFRIYGSLYLIFFVSFCLLRKKLPKLFNIRSWVPELKTDLASETEYGYISWVWKVFNFTDDDLLETCGMDALCFLRSLRLGSKLTLMGTINTIWLVPLYLTAEDALETQQLTDPFVLMSIANVPNNSPRFIGTVIAVYITILISMYLISKEYEWYIEYRHKYLAQRKARNYAIYVSGIPDDIRSSYALADYFRQSTSWSDTVYEAHIAMDIPSLEAKVAKRDKLVEKIEHITELQRRKGRTMSHHAIKIHKGEGVKRVESVSTYMKKLEILNSKITLEVGRITRSNHRMRQHLTRSSTLRNISEDDLLHQDSAVEDSDETHQRPNLGVGVSAPTLATQATSFSTMRGLDDREGSFSRIDYCGDIEEGSVFSSQDSVPNFDADGQLKSKSDASKNASVTEPSTVDSRACRQECPANTTSQEQSHEPHPFLAMFGLNPTLFTGPGLDLRDAEETLNSLSVDSPEKVHDEEDSQLALSEHEASDEPLGDDCPPSNLENLDIDTTDERLGDDFPPSNLEKVDMDSDSSLISSSSNGSRVKRKGREADGNTTAPDLTGERSSNETSKKRIWTSSKRKSSWLVGSAILNNAASVRDGVTRGAKKVGSGTAHVGSKVKLVGKVGASTVKAAGSLGVTGIKKAADFGIQKFNEAPDLAVDFGANITAQLAASASAVVPLRLGRSEGQAKEAGFVVFRDLYSTQAARQMLQHHNASSMWVEPAPDPEEVFWRNVGLPEKARRSGRILSTFATSFLCLFWSIPVAFFSSLTAVNSLKAKLPLLAQLVEDFPFLETFLALIAPLLLLTLNEAVLPFVLKWFATWEGHVGASLLDASLFVKLCAFVFIQTFFVSALSGTITDELANILNDPEEIVALLANSLPAQSSYFIQICLVFTFLLHGFDLVRAYPLTMAFFRRYVFGPRLTEKERRKTWGAFYSLEDPPGFWHAEILAQVMIFFVVFFVYCTIAPITCPFLLVCFLIMESGYRYHFVHNQKPFPDSGGKLWVGFVHVLMTSMLIGQITLFGQLLLKKTVYALPALAPLGVITILFMIFIVPKRNHVANFLPTLKCVEIDKKFKESGDNVKNFAAKEYLQPALKAGPMYPDGADIPRLRVRTMSRDGTR